MKLTINIIVLIGLTCALQNLMGMNSQNYSSKRIIRAIPYIEKFIPGNNRIFNILREIPSPDYNIHNSEVFFVHRVNLYLKGVLAGKAQLIKDEADKNGISAYFPAAVMIHESGNGSSNVARKKNNISGIYDGGNKTSKTFDSVDDCIKFTAKLLAKPLYSNCNTIEDVHLIYSPPGASNDPGKTNFAWARDVVTWMKKISENDLQVKQFVENA